MAITHAKNLKQGSDMNVIKMACAGAVIVLAACSDQQSKGVDQKASAQSVDKNVPPPTTMVEATCSSPLALSAIQEMLAEGVESRAREENKGMPEARRLDLARVRAIAGQTRVEFQDVLTSKNDPNSTKKFCEATMSIAISSDEIVKADELRRRSNLNSIKSVAEDAGFRVDVNKFSKRVSYSVQPTDDRMKLFVSLDDGATYVKLVGEAALWAVANSATGQVQTNSPAMAAGAQSVPIASPPVAVQDEALRDELNRSFQRFQAAEREINVVWRALPQSVRDAHLPAQRQFNKDKEVSCFRKATEAGAGARFEIAKNNCWADFYDKRTPELKALN